MCLNPCVTVQLVRIQWNVTLDDQVIRKGLVAMDATTGIGERLRQAREWAGYSQQEVTEVTGIAREVISYWENERRVPGVSHLGRLAVVYGTTIEVLLGQQPTPSHADEHALLFRDLREQPALTRAEVQRWLYFLDDWADLLDEVGDELPGRGVPPKREWAAPHPITDARRAAELAAGVREHFNLGLDAIPDMVSFLDQQGIFVYQVALDPIEVGGVSGIFYNHPRLGYCILTNTSTTPGRQAFTLAHELAHAYFQYQETGIVSRSGAADRKEKFADNFAAHFLVPSAALRQVTRRDQSGHIRDPYEVIRLQRYFRVSYAMLLIRLLSEGLLIQQQFDTYKGYSPRDLAAHLGLDGEEYGCGQRMRGITLGSYSPSVLERVRALVEGEDLSPATAASLLGVSQEAVLGQLLAAPAEASSEEQREFDELPPLMRSRRSAA